MNPIVVQILTVVTSLVAGGGVFKLFTLRAERTKILGQGEVERANADHTYHEMSMELVREARVEVGYLRGEVNDLRLLVKGMSSELDRKTRRIFELETENERLKAAQAR